MTEEIRITKLEGAQRRSGFSCFGLPSSLVIRHLSLFDNTRSLLLTCFSLVLLAVATFQLPAASQSEKSAFDKAEQKLTDTFYAQAEADFADFIQKCPDSDLVPKAILFQATARFYQSNYVGAIELLSSRLAAAGPVGDRFLLLMGQAYFQLGNFRTAADTFGRAVKDFPASTNRLQAAIEQANMYGLLNDWRSVTNLLQQPEGILQATIRSRTANDWVFRGYLLLSEAQLALQDFSAAEATLQPLAKLLLPPKTSWEWQFLRCRIQVAAGRNEQALKNMTNLLDLAKSTEQPALVAQSAAFQAALLERLGRLDEAAAAYTNNLVENAPIERQREALLKISQLSLAQNRTAEAMQAFERFLARFPRAAAADLAWLTLGELRLREDAARMLTNGPALALTNVPGTNYFRSAMAAFNALRTNFTKSQFIGKAYLDLGWCFWLQENLVESQRSFRAAVEFLPYSADAATAWFKLGDVDFRQKEFVASLASYSAVVEKFAGLEEVKTNLFEPALYQAVRAALAGGDLTGATNAAAKLVAWFPDSFRTRGALLLAGQQISREGDPADARRILRDLLTRSPGAAEVELEIARTYEAENDWANAIQQYNHWLDTFPNHPSRPRAEYFRAYAHFQSGNRTNAFNSFSNFVAQFPETEFTPRARWWLADYYFSAGQPEDLINAEKYYQQLFLTELGCQARMMAGRVCVARQGWKEAMYYFTNLVSEANCPAELIAQALFAYGDTLMRLDSSETNKFANLYEAIRVFNSIWRDHTNLLAALAWGRIGDCYFNSRQYALASEAYSNAVVSPYADVSTRSIAEVGLGEVLEKVAGQKTGQEQLALWEEAKRHYLRVFYGDVLREGEQPDTFWTRKAGLNAEHVAEQQHQWLQAVKICQRLKELLPQQAPFFDSRMEVCQKNLEQ
jgi:TolA-binding protein